MNFDEWKTQFREHVSELSSKADMIKGQMEALNNLYEEINDDYKKVLALLMEKKPLNGYDLGEIKRREDDANKEIKRLSKLQSEIEPEFSNLTMDPIQCPVCFGSGSVETPEFAGTDDNREFKHNSEPCVTCNGRGNIPLKELLDP